MSSERQVEHLSQRASGLNQLKCWVEALKLDAGVGGCKAPVSFDIVSVAVEEPGANLALEAAPVRDTPIETLIGQDSKFGLGHIEPAAVLGRVVPFEALDEAPCLQSRECLVEVCGVGGVEIILHENDLFGLGEMDIAQLFEDLRIINGGAPLGDLDFSPTFERGKQHEQAGGAVALVFVVVAYQSTGPSG